MHLKRTEGTVGVSDGEGRDLTPAENLGLYSGYGVDTSAASYAWVDLDEVKLTKMDENSQVEIVKEGKHLTIEVKSGSLFFNVTQPLAGDETLDIRTSTMVVGIRGTCGWVDAEHSRVGLLKGAVVCRTEDGAEAALSAGQLAELGADGQFTVTELAPEDVPAFIRDEVEAGVLPTPAPAPEETEEPEPEPSEEPQPSKRLVRQFNYYSNNYFQGNQPDTRTEYIYDERGILIRNEQYDLASGALVSYMEHTLDEQGNPVRQDYYDGNHNLCFYVEIVYDENGMEAERFEYTPDGSLSAHSVTEHDDSQGGTSISENIYTDDETISTTEAEFDEQNRAVRMETYRDGQLSEYWIYEYDEDWYAVRHTHYTADGTVIGYTILEYE